MSKRRKISKRTHGRRTQLLAAGLAVLATAFVSRAAQLQIVQGDRWQASVWTQTTETVALPAVRGAIYDRNGKALALSRQEYRAFFAPAQSADTRRDAQTIAAILDLSRSQASRLTSRSTGWIPIGQVSVGQKDALTHAVGPCVEFEPVLTRVYPEGGLARSLLGTVTAEGEGRSGLELGDGGRGRQVGSRAGARHTAERNPRRTGGSS